MKELVDAAIAVMDQYIDLLKRISVNNYTTKSQYIESTIGQHTRHTLDHVCLLLASRSQKHVNYDVRQRNKDIETNPSIARDHFEQIKANLGSLAFISTPLMVKAIVSSSQTIPITMSSSFERELWFVSVIEISIDLPCMCRSLIMLFIMLH